ncbi:MAG TPA: NAD(P)-binding domain-containing protein [Candidatus Dormibacteraeota bacterium]
MRFGVLGTGHAGAIIASKLVALGHEVTMGSRSSGNEKAVAWASSAGQNAHHGTFREAAAFGEIVINVTAGGSSLEALQSAGAENLDGKVLIDVANPLAGDGFPPTLVMCNSDSLGEQIQRAFPGARVVKALNTVTASVMVNPGMIAGGHNVFIAGNDASAKATVNTLLQSFGWAARDVVDLGDISCARGAEMYMPLWIRLYIALGTPNFNIRIVREP